MNPRILISRPRMQSASTKGAEMEEQTKKVQFLGLKPAT